MTQTLLYDDLGNVIQTTDGMSHSTTISYADRFRAAQTHQVSVMW